MSRSLSGLILSGALIAAVSPSAWAASATVSLAAGPPRGFAREDFNTIGTSATASLPSGWQFNTGASPAWDVGQTTATTHAAGTTGTGVFAGGSAAGVYNCANGVTGTSTERAPGFLTDGVTTGPRHLILGLTNNTGATLSTVTVQWRYEKYRSGTRAVDWTFFVSTDGSTWTAVPAGNFGFASDANNTTVYNPPQQFQRLVTVDGLSVANGANLYVRWTYQGVGGDDNAQALAVDNVIVSAGAFYARDDANDAAYGDWNDGDSGGTGWGGAWSLSPNPDTGNGGFFRANSVNNNSGGDTNLDADISTPNLSSPFEPTMALGFYNNGGTTTSAIRDFPFAMRVGDQFRLQLDNGNIASGNSVGFGLRNAANQNLFEFFFTGGGSSYRISDSAGVADMSGSPAFTNQGLDIVFTLTGASTYHIRALRLSSITIFTQSGTLITPGSGTQEITRMRVFNSLAGSGALADAFINTPALLDPIPPTVTGVSVVDGTTVDVTFSEAMGSGVTTPGNYTLSGTGQGTLAANPSSAVLQSGNTYRLTWAAGEMVDGGDITVTASTGVHDFAGSSIGSPNSGTHAGGGIGVLPAVSAITRQTPAGPLTNAASVTLRVLFSEDVQGGSVGLGDFTVASSGVTGASVTGVSVVDGDEADVTVSTGSGDGTVGLEVLAAATILDLAGNDLNAAFNSGESYTIDKTPPVVASFDPFELANSPAMADVTFTEANGMGAGVTTASNYTLSGSTGTLAANPDSAVLQGGTTYRLTWNTGEAPYNGTVMITVGTGVQDAATNAIVSGSGDTGSGSAVPAELSVFSAD